MTVCPLPPGPDDWLIGSSRVACACVCVRVCVCVCVCAGITLSVCVCQGHTGKHSPQFLVKVQLSELVHSLTLVFCVAVFGPVRSGPADEDGAVSVLHRAAVERVRRVPPTHHHAAVREQVRRHPHLQRRR